MTPEAEAQLCRLKLDALELLDGKYRAGNRAHGGNLLALKPLELVDEALQECIDQLTYLLSLREALKNAELDQAKEFLLKLNSEED